MKKLFPFMMLLIMAGFAMAADPVMTDVSIVVQDNTSIGYCDAADGDSDNVSYQYEWYINGTLIDDGYAYNGLYNVTQVDAADLQESHYVLSGDWMVNSHVYAYDEDWGTPAYCYVCTAGTYETWNLTPYSDVNSVTFTGKYSNSNGALGYFKSRCYNESSFYQELFSYQGGAITSSTWEVPRTCLQSDRVRMNQEVKGQGYYVSYWEGRLNFNKANGYPESQSINVANYTYPLTEGTEVTLRCRALGTITETSDWAEDTFTVAGAEVEEGSSTSAAHRGDVMFCFYDGAEQVCYEDEEAALLSISGAPAKTGNPILDLWNWFKNLWKGGDFP